MVSFNMWTKVKLSRLAKYHRYDVIKLLSWAIVKLHASVEYLFLFLLVQDQEMREL